MSERRSNTVQFDFSDLLVPDAHDFGTVKLTYSKPEIEYTRDDKMDQRRPGIEQIKEEFKNLSEDAISFLLQWEASHSARTHPEADSPLYFTLGQRSFLAHDVVPSAGPPKRFYRTAWCTLARKMLKGTTQHHVRLDISEKTKA
jgi:hypothetical protein